MSDSANDTVRGGRGRVDQTTWRQRIATMTRAERRIWAKTVWHFRRELNHAIRMGWNGGSIVEGEVDGRSFTIRICPPSPPLFAPQDDPPRPARRRGKRAGR